MTHATGVSGPAWRGTGGMPHAPGMIVLVCGGRKLLLRPYDWLRLDALHQTRASNLSARIGAVVRASLGPEQGDLLAARPTGPITTLYHGGAPGADEGSGLWAAARGIPVLPFLADWNRHGDAAGPIRNADMLAGRHPTEGQVPRPELVVAFPGGEGTADMVRKAKAAGVPVYDLRGGPAQRWGAEDIRALVSTGGLASTDLPTRVVALWAARGGGGIPLLSAHLLRAGGGLQIPRGWVYIGRECHGLAASPLGNPFVPRQGEPAEVCLGKFRAHLRQLVADRRNGIRAALESLGPDTPLVCWCHKDRPCHGEVVADAALQLSALAELRELGLSAPTP